MARKASARLQDRDFWSPARTGGRLDAVLSVVRQAVQQLTGHEPPLNSPAVYLNDHGDQHIQGVLANAQQIVSNEYIKSFLAPEQAILCCSVWLHDIGLFDHPRQDDEGTVRRLHADRSADFVRRLQERNRDTISRPLAELLAELCRAHRRNFPLDKIQASPSVPELPHGLVVRPAVLGALLRICDAADAGEGRTPPALFHLWGDQIPEQSRQHWQAHSLIHRSRLDPRNAEVIFHLASDCDLNDRALRELFIATAEDLDSTRDVLINAGLRPWSLRFEIRGTTINPGVLYARKQP